MGTDLGGQNFIPFTDCGKIMKKEIKQESEENEEEEELLNDINNFQQFMQSQTVNFLEPDVKVEIKEEPEYEDATDELDYDNFKTEEAANDKEIVDKIDRG